MRNTLCLLAVLVAACGGTSHKIKKEHRDPNWNGKPFKKILVVAFYDDRAYRVSAEGVFAAELSENAVSASPSYDVFPSLATLDNESAVRRGLAGRKFDAVLSISTLSGGEEFDYEGHQALYGWVRLLGGSGRGTRIGGYIGQEASKYHVLDIGLWDARTLKPVWNATTDSYEQDLGPDGVKKLADFMADTLKKRGLID